MDTIQDGRLDIVIFENGGREFIGKTPSNPEIPESAYLPKVESFVAQNQNLPEPKKFTGMYRMKNDILEITWGDWMGELSKPDLSVDYANHPYMDILLEKERLQATRAEANADAIDVSDSSMK